MTRRLLDCGESALLVECADLEDALALKSALEATPMPHVAELVPGARTLLVRLSDDLPAAQREELLTLTAPAQGAAAERPGTDRGRLRRRGPRGGSPAHRPDGS